MRKVLRFFIALVGLGIGCGTVALVLYNVRFPGYEYVMRYTTDSVALIVVYIALGLSSAIIFYFISPRLIDGVRGFFGSIETKLTEMPALDIAFGVIGLIVGLFLAFLISLLLRMIQVPVLPGILTVLVYLLCGYFGLRVGVSRRVELMEGFGARKGAAPAGAGMPKVLDTSVIIDGRILDICKTGFLEGPLVVPAFVLKELRHIADSADALKRGRGRRGLDILKEMQTALEQEIVLEERDYDDVDEVDVKLLRLAGDLGGALLTNDYNLNKVAAVQGARVLNINELASAVRPVVLPGEEMTLSIAKEGKEPGQGVGYLSDGTMVVVEGGRRHIGETVELIVTSALQTAAGRLIFARLK